MSNIESEIIANLRAELSKARKAKHNAFWLGNVEEGYYWNNVIEQCISDLGRYSAN